MKITEILLVQNNIRVLYKDTRLRCKSDEIMAQWNETLGALLKILYLGAKLDN